MKHFYLEDYRRQPNYFTPLSHRLKSLGLAQGKPEILDIGCGRGDFLASLKQRYPQANFHGVTISELEAKVIHRNRRFIKLKQADQLELHHLYRNHQFDLIINFHTLSYLTQSDQQRMVKLMLRQLNNYGLLILGTIDTWIKKSRLPKETMPEYIQYYYSPQIFSILNRKLKLEISFKESKHGYRVQIWRKTQPSRWQTIPLHIFLWLNLVKNNLLH